MPSAAAPYAHATASERNTPDAEDVQPDRPRERPATARRRRGRKPVIDATRMWEAAEIIESAIGQGFHLAHTHRMGWLLRRWDSWIDRFDQPRDGWVDVDSAPDGQLGALLLRHQQRQRKAPPSDKR